MSTLSRLNYGSRLIVLVRVVVLKRWCMVVSIMLVSLVSPLQLSSLLLPSPFLFIPKIFRLPVLSWKEWNSQTTLFKVSSVRCVRRSCLQLCCISAHTKHSESITERLHFVSLSPLNRRNKYYGFRYTD